MKNPMNSFRRSYLAALVVLGVFATGGAIGSLSEPGSDLRAGIALPVALGAALIPAVGKGGVAARPRLALGIASSLTLAFGVMLLGVARDFVQARGLEGPNGEGSPLAPMVAMVFFSLFFLSPWLLTSIRGLSALRKEGSSGQPPLGMSPQG